jgi:hypothetical protein
MEMISFEVKHNDKDVYFGVSKEFNLKESWNKLTTVETFNNDGTKNHPRKDYFLRKNVLLPILYRLAFFDFKNSNQNVMDFEESSKTILEKDGVDFDIFMYLCFNISYWKDLSTLEYLVKKYGKTNYELVNETSKYFGDNSKWHIIINDKKIG